MTQEQLFTVQEVAQQYKLSENTVTNAIKAQRLRALRIERQYRIPLSALREWVRDTREEQGEADA